MAVITWQRLRAFAVAGCTVIVIAACGGGGGGGAEVGTDPGTPPTGQISSIAWAQSSVQAERDVFATTGQAAITASLVIQAPNARYWFRYDYDSTIAEVNHSFRTADDGIDFSVRFVTFPERAVGSYTDTLNVTLCHDEPCTREVQGSPFRLPLRLDVGYLANAEAGVTPWAPTQTAVLDHAVMDAAYSASLDAVVTVSALPAPLLRVHALSSGITRSIPLATAPTSLSLGADGLQAAVGHDAAVSLVDLRDGAASPVRRLGVPIPVGQVVLAGTRIVALGSQAFNSNDIYWVDTTSGTATQAGTSRIYGLADAVLHPSGDRVYLADRGVSPDDVSRLDLTGDPANARIRDSRYHGEYPFCSRVAPSPDGRRLYTGCGVVLGSSVTLADDMVYGGQLPLSPSDSIALHGYVASALSVTPDSTGVALLEGDRNACEAPLNQSGNCHTRLAVYDATTLARRSLVGLAPYTRGNDRLQQWGRHLMHRADGSLIVIAEARTRDEATPTWLLHRVNP